MDNNAFLNHVLPANPYFYPYRRPPVDSDPVLLLVEEMIDYSMLHHNVHWTPPVNLQFLRMITPIVYFDEHFARTFILPDVEEEAISLASRNSFSEERWLELLDHEEARNFQLFYLNCMHNSDRHLMLHMFSFACYSCRIAIQGNRNSLVSDVVWALVDKCRQILPLEEQNVEYHVVAPEDSKGENNGGKKDEVFINEGALVLLLEELIHYYMRYNNLHGWIPALNIPSLRCKNKGYFKEKLGKVVSHFITEEEAVQIAVAYGFEENRWVDFTNPDEAKNFQIYYLWNVFWAAYPSLFHMLSFACYSSRLAIQRNRNSLVNIVVSTLVQIVSQLFPFREQYVNLGAACDAYLDLYFRILATIEDEGIGLLPEENDEGPAENSEELSDEGIVLNSSTESNQLQQDDDSNNEEGS